MEYDKSKFKIRNWKSAEMLHWIINPGLVFNEIILGQRLPKVMLIEKKSSKTLQEKTKIPCPHCGTLHSGLKWSTKNNAFKNWFGLYCDNCGKTIPCLTNLTTFLLLGLTFPVWIWFKDKWKMTWLKKQPERYQNMDLENVQNPFEEYGWIKLGLFWGLFMYIFMVLLFPLIDGEGLSTWKVVLGIPIWTIGGIGFGYTMKLINGKNIKKQNQIE
ncbi:MAG TPA: hypothetical protein PKH58_07620 [Paludibacteraceae bacterium]|nr:hypothetical protein [Paludibacteraceae bacterium]